MNEFEDLDSFDTFLAIVAKLRGPDGCPWDKAQSHETLRRYIIEECHEAVDAIDEGDRAHLAEELGDVLLQVGLHAQIGADEGTFTIADVLRSINDKLLRRHPHVFGEAHASDADEVAANWQTLKEQERGTVAESVLDGAPNSLSALARSQELQRPRRQVGVRVGRHRRRARQAGVRRSTSSRRRPRRRSASTNSATSSHQW